MTMAKLPVRVASRIAAALKKFQPILASARSRDVNESDTVVIVTDVRQEVFGYDKYADITSEHMIRSTFCDLAIQVEGELRILLEVKAIGLELKDQHVKQAVDYAANQGADWVGLTNGIEWRVYKVIFGKPLQQELVVAFDLLQMSSRSTSDLGLISLLAKESWTKAKLGEYASRRQALSRFFLGGVLLSDPVLEVVRRELRRLNPDIRIDRSEIADALCSEVLKREVIEGDSAALARRQIAKAAGRTLRNVRSKAESPVPATAV
jgi:hypothetical protein